MIQDTSTGFTFRFLKAKFAWMIVCVYEEAIDRKCFNILPNKVSLSILLHWMAKERSELSKMVMRSSSRKRERETRCFTGREIVSTKENMSRYQKKYQLYSIIGITWSVTKGPG